jgi:ribosomal protein L37E
VKTIHRVGLHASKVQKDELRRAGAVLPKRYSRSDDEELVVFEIADADAASRNVLDLATGWGAFLDVRVEFSDDEVCAAAWLRIAAWHHGYPQPDDLNDGYLEATYDLSNACSACGSGRRQNAPFQMKGEPKWGRNDMMQLIWVYDAIFAKPEVWSSVFEPHGVACRPVLNRRRKELETVVQLVVEETQDIVGDGHAAQACERCGRTKYLPVARGMFPRLRAEPRSAMVRTNEYFGSGAQSSQALLVSQAIAREIREQGIRGVTLIPVAQ